ncbi:hypothetical protein ACFWBX_06530 [Streptomyces sp. NPDC059991]|uniref:hypothetical protein n=1 Tax=Streptomyces sp. NPDC059991 TaxID=3347028 RepID=UPI0036C5FD4B
MKEKDGEAVMAGQRDVNRLLRAARLERHQTQQQIVADLADHADRLFSAGKTAKRVTVSVRQYSKWESGMPPWPHGDMRRILEDFFGRNMAELGFTPPCPVDDAAPAAPPLITGTPAEAPAGATVPTVGQRPPRLAPGGPDTGGKRWCISEQEVELLRGAADDMDAQDQQFGGVRLWRPTRAHLMWVHRMIDNGTYDDHLENQLHAVRGKFTTSLGWFCYDAGLQSEARHYFAEALNAATFTSDDALASRTLSNMARQAVDLPGRGREAIRCARLAQAHAREWGAPPRVEALLAIREAQGHASVGDTFSCEASIQRAWARWETGPTTRDPDWTTFLNEAELTCLEGMCRLDLKQHRRAQRLLAHSEKIQDIPHSRNRAMCLGRLSVAALASRDLDQTIAAATESLHLIQRGMTSTRASQQLRIVSKGLTPYLRSRGVRELTEQIREFA